MTKLLHRELTSQIIGAYYEVYNNTSRTYPEYIYEQAIFRKFFKFMGETGRFDDQTIVEVMDTLKLHRDDFLEAVEDDENDGWW